MQSPQYDSSVFVNCPFDDAYRLLFRALIFAIRDCGYLVHCAMETEDGSEVRIDKIAGMISGCRFGIHDISRTDADASTGLPRFNMPFELGLFLGAKRYGRVEQKRKNCLILDVERYRYQKFLSDIAGQDIAAHGGDPVRVIRLVRDWLANATPRPPRVPSGRAIAARFALFHTDLPVSCAANHTHPDELTFNDYLLQVEEWLALNAYIPS